MMLAQLYWLPERHLLVARAEKPLGADVRVCEELEDGNIHLLGCLPALPEPTEIYIKLAGNERVIWLLGTGGPQRYELVSGLRVASRMTGAVIFGLQQERNEYRLVQTQVPGDSVSWAIRTVRQNGSAASMQLGPVEDPAVVSNQEQCVKIEFSGKLMKVFAVDGTTPAEIRLFHYHPQTTRKLRPILHRNQLQFALNAQNLKPGEEPYWEFELNLAGCEEMSLLIPVAGPASIQIWVGADFFPEARAVRYSPASRERTYMPVSEHSTGWRSARIQAEEQQATTVIDLPPAPLEAPDPDAWLEPLRFVLETSSPEELQFYNQVQPFLRYVTTFPPCFIAPLIAAAKRLARDWILGRKAGFEQGPLEFFDRYGDSSNDPATLFILSHWPHWCPGADVPVGYLVRQFLRVTEPFFPFALNAWLERELVQRNVTPSGNLTAAVVRRPCAEQARAIQFLLDGFPAGDLARFLLTESPLPAKMSDLILRARTPHSESPDERARASSAETKRPLPAEEVEPSVKEKRDEREDSNFPKANPATARDNDSFDLTTEDLESELAGSSKSFSDEFGMDGVPLLIPLGRARAELGLRLSPIAGGRPAADQLFDVLDDLLKETEISLRSREKDTWQTLAKKWRKLEQQRQILALLQEHIVRDFRIKCAERLKALIDRGTNLANRELPDEAQSWSIGDLRNANSILREKQV